MIEALVTGFYNQLKGNVALQTKLGGVVADPKIYHAVGLQGTIPPYIVFGLLTDVPESTFAKASAIERTTFYVNIFSKTSPANLLQIADLVFTAMDDVSLTVTGYSSMVCRREYTGNIMQDYDTRIYMMALRYRVLIGKN
jgi:hypothetical protein